MSFAVHQYISSSLNGRLSSKNPLADKDFRKEMWKLSDKEVALQY